MARSYQTKGSDGASSLTPPVANYVNIYSLSANTAKTITWPTGYQFMNISAPAAYWLRSGGTAVVGSTDVTDGTGSALNPTQRQRGYNENTISIISATAQVISVEFWTSGSDQER